MECSLSRADLYRLVVRSFCLQATWNFERMQNLGFLYGISPILNLFHKDKRQRIEAYKRHLDFFNTQPYFANVVVGIVARLEEQLAKEGSAKPEQINTLKMSMGSAFGAIGDSLFWGTWRPFSALIGSVLVLIITKLPFLFYWPLFFLVLYNWLHLHVRIKGVIEGYQMKTQVVEILKRMNYSRTIRLCHFLGTIITLLSLTVIFFQNYRGVERFWFILLFVVLVLTNARGLSSFKLFYFLFLISLLGGYFAQ